MKVFTIRKFWILDVSVRILSNIHWLKISCLHVSVCSLSNSTTLTICRVHRWVMLDLTTLISLPRLFQNLLDTCSNYKNILGYSMGLKKKKRGFKCLPYRFFSSILYLRYLDHSLNLNLNLIKWIIGPKSIIILVQTHS